MSELFLTAYAGNDKGIVKLLFDKDKKEIIKKGRIQIEGKCNMVIESDQYLYMSVKYTDNNFLEIYKKDTFNKIKSIQCSFFYSYGQKYDHYLLLASYENGVDSVYDLETDKFISHYEHKKKGINKPGKSHYIKQLSDNKIVSVDNLYQQIYVYKSKKLEIEEIVQLEEKNIRLLSFHPTNGKAYLNTELTNELLVLDLNNFEIIKTYKLTECVGSYSGGNALSHDGKYLAITLRGENCICLFETKSNGLLNLVTKSICGKTPRDVIFMDDYLFVSCTDENAIEVYEIDNLNIKKVNEVKVDQPITFAMV